MTAPTPAPRSLADRLAGALLGLAVGDALGFVVEAEPPDVAAAYAGQLAPGRIPERSHGAFPLGQYSDDTQLARELLLSVREAGGWSPVGLRSSAGGARCRRRAGGWRVGHDRGRAAPRRGSPVGFCRHGAAVRRQRECDAGRTARGAPGP